MKQLYYYCYRLTFLILLLATAPDIIAQKKQTIYEQLLTVNREWQNQPDVPVEFKSTPALTLSPNDLHTFHLVETEKLLRKRNTNKLSCEQQANRHAKLDLLNAYWKENKCPINETHSVSQPVFIDELNTYCAVGYMMSKSGADDIAREISKTENYSYLGDISNPGLMNWVRTSGLSFSELALIQPINSTVWPTCLTEFHYNNVGADLNEYIEIHQGRGWASPDADTVLFYDHNGVLYKTLKASDMQVFNSVFYYYQFPPGESFADSGTIRLVCRTTAWGGPKVLSIYHYNSSSVHLIDSSALSYSGVVRQKFYNTGEDESSQPINSLNFIGVYETTWNLVSMPATRGFLNPLTIGTVPITLSSFDYSINGKAVELKWQTASEINSENFMIERSIDGMNFETIGNVKAAGTSNHIIQYTFIDQHSNHVNHYRLKQVDRNGRSSYSKILFVKVSRANPVIIKGNPATENLLLELNFGSNLSGTIKIYDLYGKEYFSIKTGRGSRNIDISSLVPGEYLVRLYTSDKQVYNAQFIKMEK